MTAAPSLKDAVRSYWNRESCGEIFATGDDSRAQYEAVRESRYRLEPYIATFANFVSGKGKDVLEIGVGMGTDHVEWAKASPKSLTGIDLTPRGVEHTKTRLGLYGLSSNVQVGDAENLPFADNSFDIVYSFGVLHHSPDTARALQEVRRVLRPGGTAKIMIYNLHALTGYILWVRHALLKGKPFRTLYDVYFHHLESPGTKCYTPAQAKALFQGYSKVDIQVQMNHGDLMLWDKTQKSHGSLVTRLLRRVWPRWFFRVFMPNHGLYLMIQATK